VNIYLHLTIHFLLSILAGYVVFRFWDKKWRVGTRTERLGRSGTGAIIGGILGGFFIDLDHLIDYFLVFGWKFNLNYFLKGWSFAKSDYIYIFFHSWELVLLLLIIFLILKKGLVKTFTLALALGMCAHLFTDYTMTGAPASLYFLTHRAKNEFKIEKLFPPEDYQSHLEDREWFENNISTK